MSKSSNKIDCDPLTFPSLSIYTNFHFNIRNTWNPSSGGEGPGVKETSYSFTFKHPGDVLTPESRQK